MSVAKYLNKVANRMEKEFLKRGYEDGQFFIDGRIEGRTPYLYVRVLDEPHFRFNESEYSLANEYIAYMEDDISVKNSIKDKITEIFADIKRMMEMDIIEADEEELEPD